MSTSDYLKHIKILLIINIFFSFCVFASIGDKSLSNLFLFFQYASMIPFFTLVFIQWRFDSDTDKLWKYYPKQMNELYEKAKAGTFTYGDQLQYFGLIESIQNYK